MLDFEVSLNENRDYGTSGTPEELLAMKQTLLENPCTGCKFELHPSPERLDFCHYVCKR